MLVGMFGEHIHKNSMTFSERIIAVLVVMAIQGRLPHREHGRTWCLLETSQARNRPEIPIILPRYEVLFCSVLWMFPYDIARGSGGENSSKPMYVITNAMEEKLTVTQLAKKFPTFYGT